MKELQKTEIAKAKLQMLTLEFHLTLTRLPKFKKEIDILLQQGEGIHFEELVKCVECSLDKATNLLLDLDMLPRSVRNSPKMQEFEKALVALTTMRTVNTLLSKFLELLKELSEKDSLEQSKTQRYEATDSCEPMSALMTELIKKKESQRISSAYEFKKANIIKGIEFIKIPAGQFMMGEGEETLVEISPAFELGKYLVTQAQWKAVLGENPSHFKGENLPVENVSWFEVRVFIEKLNRLTGITHCLPTEEQWEYACCAGSTTSYCAKQRIEAHQANFNNNIGKTTPVGIYPPNAWGLYDMLGNVWEWTASTYTEAEQNSRVGMPTSWRVLRGGSWGNLADFMRPSYRYFSEPNERDYNIGFRLARLI